MAGYPVSNVMATEAAIHGKGRHEPILAEQAASGQALKLPSPERGGVRGGGEKPSWLFAAHLPAR